MPYCRPLFKLIFLNENIWVLNKILLKVAPAVQFTPVKWAQPCNHPHGTDAFIGQMCEYQLIVSSHNAQLDYPHLLRRTSK